MANIAVSFVNLALRYGSDWSEVQRLTIPEFQRLLRTVTVAGFQADGLIPGRMEVSYRGDTGIETHVVNTFCPFKVLYRQEDQRYATGWLDCALRLVVDGTKEGKYRGSLVEAIRAEIERAVPLRPIQLTAEREYLVEFLPRPFGPDGKYPYFIDHVQDTDALGPATVGLHLCCGGCLDRIKVAEDYDVIACRSCNLRVHFPSTVGTYRDLREHLEAQLAQTSA